MTSSFDNDSRLRGLGYTAAISSEFERLALLRPDASLEPARIVFESHQQFQVIRRAGESDARLAARWDDDRSPPTVGDWVTITYDADGVALVHDLLPRSTRLSRKVAGKKTREQVVAANIDTVFLVMGLDGDYNLRRLERFAVMAWESRAQPVVVLTKADLHEDVAGARLDAQAVAPGMPVFAVSALQGVGLDPLRAFLDSGQTVALIGSSGAGKSTLLNSLCGREVMATGEVRESDSRGRHTTTHRQLVRLPGGGLLVDNPGIREIQLWADSEALDDAFPEIDELARGCRFTDCSHETEPGCAVLHAVSEGTLDRGRLESWKKLGRELESLERRQDVAQSRKEDRRLGKFIKRALADKKARRRGH